MGKLIHTLFIGIIGAGLVHIAQVFLLPVVAENDAWARLTPVAATGEFLQIDPQSNIAASMRALDRNFTVGACLFSLEEGPVQIVGPKAPSFWSMSVYNRRGENVYSLNDRITADGALDVIVATPVQIIELQNNPDEDFSRSAIAETDIDDGFVVLRAFQETRSMKAQTEAFIAASRCDNF